jgi:hypothetical protein
MKHEYILIIITLLLIPIGIKLNKSGNIVGKKCKRWGEMFKNKKVLKNMCSVSHLTQGFIAGYLLLGNKYFYKLLGNTWYNRILIASSLTYPSYNLFKRYVFCKKYFWDSSYFINLFEFISGVVLGTILSTTQESIVIKPLVYQIIIGILLCINITSYLISVPTVDVLTNDSKD